MPDLDAVQPEPADTAPASSRPAFRVRLGITLIVLSCVFWFGLLAIPFLPLDVAQKSALGAAVFVAVQVAWWGGAAIAGPAAIGRLMTAFRRFLPGRKSSKGVSKASDK
jgi:hypothetical protein